MMPDPVGGREAEREAVWKVVQEACDEALRIHKFGVAAVMVTRALRDHGWEIVRSSGSAAQRCQRCRGTGAVRQADRNAEWQTVCPACGGSGSAAQNQEDEGLSIHVDVCPGCGEPTSYHPMDPPMQCTHDRERYVPVRFIEARSPQDEDHDA